VRDGEIVPACAQTCPAQAIVFGNILDTDSKVYAKSQEQRAYRVLEELGTQPAVYYLESGGEHAEG
jgi:molybdopterin-containing oxidoreductase family iron-sulfur binding subunit